MELENVNPNESVHLTDNSFEKRTTYYKGDNGDSKDFVLGCLQNIGLGNEINVDKDLSRPAIRIIESLFNEKTLLQSHYIAQTDESSKLRQQVTCLSQQTEKESNSNASLKQDVQLLNSRVSSLNAEHREVRNHWLGEKSDLEGRLFQLQALNTQIQGRMKKKEKEHANLQLQMAKLVKDASRGNKAIINISVPLKKNLSQLESSKGKGLLLRDAEIIANKTTIANLDKENASLRQAVDSMQSDILTLKEQLESSVVLTEWKYQNQIDTLIKEHGITLQQKEASLKDIQLRLSAATVETGTKATAASILTSPVQRKVVPGSLVKQYLEGTPGSRPVRWVVEQVNTEIKRLRDRAEQVGEGVLPACNEKFVDSSDFFNSNPKYSAMKVRLMEALAVIQEQDRLIHEALLGRLPGTASEKDSPSICEQGDRDQFRSGLYHNEVDYDYSNFSDDHVTAGAMGSSEKSRSSLSLEPLWFDDSDLLPPASPATIEILEAYGWWNLPRRQPSSKKASCSPSGSNDSTGNKGLAAGAGGVPSSSTPSTFTEDFKGQHLKF